MDQAMSRSADNVTFARELIKALNDPDSQNSALLLNDFDRTDALHKILLSAGVQSKIVGVIELEDGRRRQTIQPMV
ncbi:UUP1 family membrane protein, partial [Escherichia coli]|nr:UUP1 family membrane protein [Escherichia coli]